MTKGEHAHISPFASLRNGPRIRIGNDVFIGERACLWAGDSTGRITMGDNVMIAPGAMLTASNYGASAGQVMKTQPRQERDVLIGNDVWIGANAVILPGAVIGDGCIIGAGAVVSGTCEPGGIFVGVPARQRGSRS